MRVKRNCSAAWFEGVADRAHIVFETLIHDIDLLLWFSGSQATRVMAMERRFGSHLSPEGCFALIQFASGCVGIAETSWFVPAQAPANVITDTWQGTIDAELAVVGTHRTAQLRLLDGPLQIWGEQGAALPRRAALAPGPGAGRPAAGTGRFRDRSPLGHPIGHGFPEPGDRWSAHRRSDRGVVTQRPNGHAVAALIVRQPEKVSPIAGITFHLQATSGLLPAHAKRDDRLKNNKFQSWTRSG
jgi:hypothetical protein